MLTIAHKPCMTSKFRHLLQISLHIIMLTKQFISKQAVYRENCGSPWKISANHLNGLLDNFFVICKLQQN